MKRLQLVRKKLLPLLLCVAVAGSQVPVMAADVEGFSDSAEGFNEEWSEDTQTQSAEAEDTTETAEVQILLERYAYSEISGTFILI